MNLVLTKLAFGGGVFLFGFSIVFFGLIVLMSYIILQSKFFVKKGKKTKKLAEVKTVAAQSNDFISQQTMNEDSVIAAISAAVAMYLGTSAGDVVIKSYRRIGANAPAWRQAGRRDSIFNKF